MKFQKQWKLEKAITELRKLLESTPKTMGDLVHEYPTYHGVYSISNFEDSEIIYVGMTKSARDGIGSRLWDHISNSGSSDLKQMMNGCKESAKSCNVRIIRIEDAIERRNVEAAGIAALSPRFNR